MASATRDEPGLSTTRWPNGAQAAIALTCDNLGEAADINRGLWPKTEPIGKHYTVVEVIPKILGLLKKYNISVTYFIESWNIEIYGDFILHQIAAAGHEIGWHAWQHEAWHTLKDYDEERSNFERSFGKEGVQQWVTQQKLPSYAGFRPPGGIIHGARTMRLAHEFGLKYISPAAEDAAVVDFDSRYDGMVVLPFKWATVDAYYYMESFAGLRKLKGGYTENTQPPSVLVRRFIHEIDKAIQKGSFLSLLFHPFLTNKPERLAAMEEVLTYLALKRDEGQIWLAPCRDIQEFIQDNKSVVGVDPHWDTSIWR